MLGEKWEASAILNGILAVLWAIFDGFAPLWTGNGLFWDRVEAVEGGHTPVIRNVLHSGGMCYICSALGTKIVYYPVSHGDTHIYPTRRITTIAQRNSSISPSGNKFTTFISLPFPYGKRIG